MQFGVGALISIVAIESILTLLSLNVDLIPTQTSQLPQTALTTTDTSDTNISSFFNDSSLHHYNDQWQNLTNTNWYSPISNTTRKSRKKWKYDIINYPIIPFFLKSKKKRVNISLISYHIPFHHSTDCKHTCVVCIRLIMR
eukprot:387969_1